MVNNIRLGPPHGKMRPFHRVFHLFTACWHQLEADSSLVRAHDLQGTLWQTPGPNPPRRMDECCICHRKRHTPVIIRGGAEQW